jgi:phospholipid transport system substrate-binding protein
MLVRLSGRNLRALIAISVISLAPFAIATTAAAAESLQSFVQQNVDQGYALLNNDSLSDAQRNAQFRGLMLSLMDTQRVGRFTLGPYANSASQADLAEFQKAFADYAVAVYQSRIALYKGAKIRVTGTNQLAPDDAVVNAELTGPSLPNPKDPIRVGFRIRSAADGHHVITDMEVEGVWVALWERADFTSFLQQHGGSVTALTEHLRSQTQQIIGESSSAPAAR